MKKITSIFGCILLAVIYASVGGGERGSKRGTQGISSVQNNQNMRMDADYGRMPLYFIPNEGQMDKQVAYYVQGKDKTLYFTQEGITLALAKSAESKAGSSRAHSLGSILAVEEAAPKRRNAGTERWVVKLDFVGANKEVVPVGDAETGAVVSYFRGKPEEWRTGVPTYSKITYPNLWPGIDLVYYGTVNRLKYEFIVQPGADPSKIRLAYRGVETLSVDKAGRLKVTTPVGGFQDDAPVAYQEREGKKTQIKLDYRIYGQSSCGKNDDQNAGQAGLEAGDRELARKSDAYGFDIGKYDRTLPLVLDPAILVYCGYIGGSGADFGFGISVDSSGSAYVTGYTSSTEATFPVTAGPDLTFNGGGYDLSDAFVAKVNAAGTALVYCGYIGGSDGESGRGIAVDESGNAYVIGKTKSTEATFPVTVGPDLIFNGWEDAFVAKVNAAGTALVYCGYIGGSGSDDSSGIAVDGLENVYVIGSTTSTEATFPVTVGPDLTFNGGPWAEGDAYVAKVNAAGTSLIYCGYIGGSGGDVGSGVAVDASGNAYIAGFTGSTEATFPVTVGPDLISSVVPGIFDAFVAKVSASGTSLIYCGYIGGSGGDGINGIAVDRSGNAYVTGFTYSTEATFPVTVGPDLTYNSISAGIYDAFVAKVNASGTALVYCGYIGGSSEDEGKGIAVDRFGNAYITGYTRSTEATFPVTAGPDLTFNSTYGEDAFVAKVNASGTTLVYCGYIGGDEPDYGSGIAVDGSGNAFVTGYTNSTETTFPVTVGPYLTYKGIDAFVAKISYASPSSTKFGTYFFYWHDAPDNNWDPSKMRYHPTGTYAEYSSLEKSWYAAEISDMTRAGIDYVFPVCWGNHPWPYFRISVLSNLAATISDNGSNLKVGLFDDTASECSEWNADNGRGYVTSTPMPIDNTYNWSYFYDRKIKPFFQLFPRSMWATHNGSFVEDGGKPIIIVYSGQWFSGHEMSDEMWTAIKNAFQSDFKDARGKGITPFVVLEDSWFLSNSAVSGAVDGRYGWGAALSGSNSYEMNGYRVSAVGPGYDDRLIRSPGSFQPRNTDIDGNPGPEDYFMATEFAKITENIPFDPSSETKHLIMIETWNELWEGTAIERCSDYPADAGGYLPETFYIDRLKKLTADYRTPPPTPAEIKLNRSRMNFGSAIGGDSTQSQDFTISNSGTGVLNWTVTDDAAWLSCTPSSGTGSQEVIVAVTTSGLGAGTYTAAITVSSANASNSPQTIGVTLKVYNVGGSGLPFGYFETPVDGTTGIEGSVPVTGWVLDDIEATKVDIWRDPIGGEPVHPNGYVYIGDAVFVEGARPDVETAYPKYPLNYRAGWGYMMLTNFLPGQGNGIFSIHAIAYDKEGHGVKLGTKTIGCDNAHATLPFGAIDTPAQGGTWNGTQVNFGWALTPMPKSIPTDGSTIWLWIDGQPIGHPTYNNYREDIATLFPGFANSNGAVGYFYVDTTQYANGVHTIAWSVEDSAAAASGIGSRYFTVVNTGTGSAVGLREASALSISGGSGHGDIASLTGVANIPTDFSSPVHVRRGFNLAAPAELIFSDESGVITIESREVDRIEISLSKDAAGKALMDRARDGAKPAGLHPSSDERTQNGEDSGLRDQSYVGYLVVGNALRRLPIGSTLDPKRGVFSWQLGPGFVGEYNFVFISEAGGSKSKKDIRVRIHPAHSNLKP